MVKEMRRHVAEARAGGADAAADERRVADERAPYRGEGE
jgi:hypothetical protein